MGEESGPAPRAGERWRLVTTQGVESHVSSVVLSEEEARQQLDIEADVHRKFGWTVTRGEDVVVARRMGERGLIERVVTIRVSGPLDDAV